MLTPPTPTSHAPPCLQEPLGAGVGEKTGSRGPPSLPHPAQGLATLHLLRGLRLPPAKPASWKGLSSPGDSGHIWPSWEPTASVLSTRGAGGSLEVLCRTRLPEGGT